MKGDLFIHVGLHKTGTTFLQRNVFPKIKDVNLQICDKLYTFKPKKDKLNILSCEGFSGHPHRFDKFEIRYLTAKNLSKFYPTAKILLVLREKESWVRSLYFQYLFRGGTATFDQFRTEIFDERWLNFEEYINKLEKFFPEVYVMHYEDFKENNELFIKKLCHYFNVDVPKIDKKRVNKSFSQNEKEFMRHINKFIFHRRTYAFKLWWHVMENLKN